jgi:signal transduction histidine kinase
VATVGVDSVCGDVLDEVQAASAELARFKTVPDVAEAALGLGLALTRSAVAFLAVFDETGDDKRVFSKAADESQHLRTDEVERLFATASWPAFTSTSAPRIRYACARPLEWGGRPLGMIGVASQTGYTATQERTFTIIAYQVAASVALAQLFERRQEMVDTLVNLRADLDRSEKQRLINQERARSADKVERAHVDSVDALLAVSRHARTGHGLTDFYRRLTRSIAELVAAEKVLFWSLDERGFLSPLPGAYGIDEEFYVRLHPAPCAPDRDDLASRVVFHDLMFRARRPDEARDYQYVLDRLDVRDAIAVPWRAGDERLGLVAAYDSRRPDGFPREDSWVLQKAGLAAGLVWQLKHAETDLRRTVERLERVDAARQLLLHNVSTAVDEARRRFAGDLHDDALQKLTAAQLQLQRVRDPSGDQSVLIAETQLLLSQTEEALRRLLCEVRPPALEMPGGFLETIRERIRLLESLTGAEVEVDIHIPDELSHEYRSLLFRQLTEALANVEKHASATRVQVSLRTEDGGVRGLVKDDGRGFVVAEREHLPGHLGLLALSERAVLAGGWNKITSESGMGASVEFWLPFAEESGR